MTWWLWLWCGLLVAGSFGGAMIGRKEGEPWWSVAVGLFGALGCPVCVLNAYAVIRLGDLRWFAAVVLAALVYSIWRDIEESLEDGSLTRGESALAIVICLVLYAPAAFHGLVPPP